MLWIKLKQLFGSIRFWIITLTAITAILEKMVIGTLEVVFIFNTVQAWLVAIAALGTMDSMATKFGAAFAKK